VNTLITGKKTFSYVHADILIIYQNEKKLPSALVLSNFLTAYFIFTHLPFDNKDFYHTVSSRPVPRCITVLKKDDTNTDQATACI